MKKLMRTLVEVGFRGILIADHVPGMVGGKTGWAYSIGYIKALYDMARDEKAGLSLTAIVEDGLDRSDEAILFALATMERSRIAVAGVSEMPRLAEVARRELRV